MISDTRTTMEVCRIVRSRVAHWIRLNSAWTSIKNCRILLNMALFGLDVMTSLPEPRQGGNHDLVLCRPDRGRTCDLRIWNPLLYQLSYWPVQGDGSMSLEPESRIEPPTFSLPRKRSTTELPRLSSPIVPCSKCPMVGREGFEPSKA